MKELDRLTADTKILLAAKHIIREHKKGWFDFPESTLEYIDEVILDIDMKRTKKLLEQLNEQ